MQKQIIKSSGYINQQCHFAKITINSTS